MRQTLGALRLAILSSFDSFFLPSLLTFSLLFWLSAIFKLWLEINLKIYELNSWLKVAHFILQNKDNLINAIFYRRIFNISGKIAFVYAYV